VLWHCWEGFLRVITQGHPQEAMGYCRKAVALTEETDIEGVRAFIECCKAQIHLIAGDLLAGQLAGIRAVASFEARKNMRWACRTLWHLSSIANAMEAWEESLEYCRRALAHGRAVGETRLIIVGLWRTGSTLILSGNPEAGLLWCDEALALSPLPLDLAMIQAVHGNGLVKIGEIDKGVGQLEESVAWFGEASLPHMRIVFAMHLGDGYVQQGRIREARKLFTEIVAVSKDKGYCRHQTNAERYLCDIEKGGPHVDASEQD
jgi:tetratricopeptide (TPR) repeat protein